jgi:hypothetical protein
MDDGVGRIIARTIKCGVRVELRLRRGDERGNRKNAGNRSDLFDRDCVKLGGLKKRLVNWTGAMPGSGKGHVPGVSACI